MHLTPLRAAATIVGSLTVGCLLAGPAGAAPLPETTGSSPVVAATDRDVTFTVDGTVTYGTLHVPAHRAGRRLAAALLLPGSGPTDRNGDQLPNLPAHTLALLADALGADGIMTFRFDKYLSGQTGAGAYAGKTETIDLPAFVRQVTAGYRTLRAQPETDPRAMLIVGHSEGGMTALLAALRVRPRPAGLALLAPQAIRLLDIIDLQLGQQLAAAVTAGRLGSGEAETARAAIRRIITDFRAGNTWDTTGLVGNLGPLLRSLLTGVNERFVRSDDAVYPPDVARRIAPRTRTLVTCGTADVQVPCDILGPLANALRRAGTTGPGLMSLPGVDHLQFSADVSPDRPTLAAATVAALRDFDRPWAIPAPEGRSPSAVADPARDR